MLASGGSTNPENAYISHTRISREKGKSLATKGKKGKRAGSYLMRTPTLQPQRARTIETKRFPGHGWKAVAALPPPNLR